MRTESALARVGGVVALVFSVLIFADVMLDEAARGRGYDFAPLRAAGRLAETEQLSHLYAQDPNAYNLVDDAVFQQAARDGGFVGNSTPFVYPPLVAGVMRLLSAVPFAELVNAWALVSIALFVVSASLVLRAYLPRWDNPYAHAALLLALCCFEPMRYSMWLGQTTPLILTLVLGAVLFQRHGWPVAAGVALSLAAFVKITPAVLVLVWMWRGPRRAVVAFGIGLFAMWTVSIAAMGLDVHVAYVERVLAASRATLVAFNNHSLITFLFRLAVEPGAWLDWRYRTPPSAVMVLNGMLTVLMIVIAITILRRGQDEGTQRSRLTAEAVAFLVLLLVPNISWTHYFVFLLPAMAVVLSMRSPGAVPPIVACAAAFILCCRPLLPSQALRPSANAGPLSLSLPTLAAVLLFVTVMVIAARSPRTSPAVQFERV